MSKVSEIARGVGGAAAIAMLCATAPGTTIAAVPFAEAQLFFELNDTDGDLGIHALIDGNAWKQLRIEDPDEREILFILATGSLRRQGMTEFFFESAEPSFDDLRPEQFFRRFPAGTYEISAVPRSGTELGSEVVVSHVMPAPAGNISIGGQPAAENCDAAVLPKAPGNQTLTVSWAAVTTSHPEIGDPGNVTIAEYEVIVEADDVKLSANLPPGQTQLQVPASFLALSDEWKLEILARATNFNRTAVETCFTVD